MGKTREAIRRMYRERRKAHIGHYRGGKRYEHVTKATWALRDAKIRHSWEVLESLGLVRLTWEPDDCIGWDELCGDCYDPRHNPEIAPERLERQKKAFLELCEREGVWSLIGEYRDDIEDWRAALDGATIPYGRGQWEHGDSVGGFVGHDAGGYETDIMQQTINALRDRLKSRCNSCRR